MNTIDQHLGKNNYIDWILCNPNDSCWTHICFLPAPVLYYRWVNYYDLYIGMMQILVISTKWNWLYHIVIQNKWLYYVRLTCTRFQNGAKLATGWDATEQSGPIMRISVSVLLVTCSMNPCTAGELLHCRGYVWEDHVHAQNSYDMRKLTVLTNSLSLYQLGNI